MDRHVFNMMCGQLWGAVHTMDNPRATTAQLEVAIRRIRVGLQLLDQLPVDLAAAVARCAECL